jgi:DNA polymerase III subunit epsilon
MYAVIDLETTGGSAAKDRITEIAVVVHDGQRIVREFSTLINPERPIPSYITDITGIDDDMVASAPRFYEIAKEVVELTDGCIFVAHNVSFDYGFLQEEFARLAYKYEREKLCTVRMSRVLIPGLPSYSLGRLCHTLGIQIHARHRAKGDVDATVLLLEHLLRLQPNLGQAQRKPAKDPYAHLPKAIDRNSLRLLPDSPGLYFFHDAGGAVVHVNASRSIRLTALKELQQLGKSKPKGGLDPELICEVTWELTGNELLAQLRLETERAKTTVMELAPKEKSTGKFAVFAYADQRGYLRLYTDKLQRGKPSYGQFATEADARAVLEVRLRKHGLCAQLGGFESGSGACSWHTPDDLGCAGACLGLESADAYNQRLEIALQGLGFPHPAFFLLGDGRQHGEIAVIGIEQGQLLGFAYLDETETWDDPEWVKGLLKPLPSSESSKQILKQYLGKHVRSRLVPF